MVELEQVLDVLAESLDGAAHIHQMNEEAPFLNWIPWQLLASLLQ